jgi:hypothetical protein
MAITAPASRQEAIAPRRLATGSTDHRCKWIALSDTTIGVLMAAMNASIVPIALPDVFRGITLCRWPDPVASTLSWWPGQLWSRLYVMSYQILHVHPPHNGDVQVVAIMGALCRGCSSFSSSLTSGILPDGSPSMVRCRMAATAPTGRRPGPREWRYVPTRGRKSRAGSSLGTVVATVCRQEHGGDDARRDLSSLSPKAGARLASLHHG